MHEDVEVRLSAADGNVFGIIGTVSKALKRAGYHDDARTFQEQASKAHSYDEVLTLVMETVEVY